MTKYCLKMAFIESSEVGLSGLAVSQTLVLNNESLYFRKTFFSNIFVASIALISSRSVKPSF